MDNIFKRGGKALGSIFSEEKLASGLKTRKEILKQKSLPDSIIDEQREKFSKISGIWDDRFQASDSKLIDGPIYAGNLLIDESNAAADHLIYGAARATSAFTNTIPGVFSAITGQKTTSNFDPALFYKTKTWDNKDFRDNRVKQSITGFLDLTGSIVGSKDGTGILYYPFKTTSDFLKANSKWSYLKNISITRAFQNIHDISLASITKATYATKNIVVGAGGATYNAMTWLGKGMINKIIIPSTEKATKATTDYIKGTI